MPRYIEGMPNMGNQIRDSYVKFNRDKSGGCVSYCVVPLSLLSSLPS